MHMAIRNLMDEVDFLYLFLLLFINSYFTVTGSVDIVTKVDIVLVEP
jgi:hypothetical protein